MRVVAITTLIIGTFGTLPAAEGDRPLAPTPVTWEQTDAVLGAAAAALKEQAHVPIDVAPGVLKAKFAPEFKGFKGVPFWDGLQQLADASKTRITLAEGGRRVNLVPRGPSREAAATSGAFRVAAQQVIGRALLEQGVTVHEVQLLVHWEPRLRVYRIDTTPRVTKVTDVPGSKVVADEGGSQVLPADATSEMRVRLTGLTRDSGRITALSGVFTATGADRLLAFAFEAPAGKLPAARKADGVAAELKRVQKKGDLWEVVVEVMYPAGQPTFQSFEGEWWLRDNRMLLRSPEGKTVVLDDFEIPSRDNPRPLQVVYRFKQDPAKGLGDPTAKGWAIVYETPAPLAEIKVPFDLKDIPLP
jgi:hypothetical protein